MFCIAAASFTISAACSPERTSASNPAAKRCTSTGRRRISSGPNTRSTVRTGSYEINRFHTISPRNLPPPQTSAQRFHGPQLDPAQDPRAVVDDRPLGAEIDIHSVGVAAADIQMVIEEQRVQRLHRPLHPLVPLGRAQLLSGGVAD